MGTTSGSGATSVALSIEVGEPTTSVAVTTVDELSDWAVAWEKGAAYGSPCQPASPARAAAATADRATAATAAATVNMPPAFCAPNAAPQQSGVFK